MEKVKKHQIYEKLLVQAKAKDFERAATRFPNYETIYLIRTTKEIND